MSNAYTFLLYIILGHNGMSSGYILGRWEALVNHSVDPSLQAEGYAIWIDIEKMGGSTLEAMAHAVENAAVVLVCMSEKYKQSPNCRTGEFFTPTYL